MRRTKFYSSSIKMRRRNPPPSKRIRFIFDREWQPLVRLEEYHASGLRIIEARKLVEQQRTQHYAAQPNQLDPYWTPHGRLVSDWLDTLRKTGSTSATELYKDFIRWASEWEDIDPAEFTHTRWGRIMNNWVPKRRMNHGVVYDGVSLP